MANPILLLRKDRALSRGELARKLGSAYSSVASLELGYWPRIPPKWKAKLRALGLSYEELNAQYQHWRAQASATVNAGREARD